MSRFARCFSLLGAKSSCMRLPQLLLFLLTTELVLGQCFNPPTGYTIYSTTNVAAYGTAITGFESTSNTKSGFWTVNAATDPGVMANFLDSEGRSSTVELSGTGTLFIDAEITENFVVTDNCTQSYTVANYSPVIVNNPGLPETCPLNIVLVLDESGSIADNMSTGIVRDAVLALVNNLNDSGSQLALVEFASTAKRIFLNGSNELATVNAAMVSAITSYFDNEYVPVSNPNELIGGTNWEDALMKASEVNNADIILMITDGRPTFYNIGNGMGGSMGIAGEGDLFDITALKEAQDVANSIKTAGTRIFVAELDFPSNVQSIIDITGPNEIFSPGSIEDLAMGDYTIITPSSLVGIFSGINAVCEEPETIPTMGEWGVFILFMILLIFATTTLRQKEAQLQKNLHF